VIARCLAVTGMTLRRLRRSRLLWGALVISLFIVGTYAISLTYMFPHEAKGRSLADDMNAVLGTLLPVHNTLSMVIAILIGVTVVRRDVVDGTVASVLSKPVTRGEYIAATYTGAAFYLLVIWLLFVLELTILATVLGKAPGQGVYLACLGRYVTSVMVMGIALCASIRVRPWIAVILTLVVLRGRTTVSGLQELTAAMGAPIPEAWVTALQFPFPIVTALDPLVDRLTRGALAQRSDLSAFVHVADYGIVMAVCAYLLFRGLEINRVRE
jgi:hypothetical protein